MAGTHQETGDAEVVVIDRRASPWRWRCPNGHTSWDRTNNHVWCGSCQRAAEAGADVEPEHWAIVDERSGERIDYASVEFAADRR